MQLAKAFGAEVTGVCSTTKVDMVRSLGADLVIDYTHDDFAEGEQRHHVILDTGGNSSCHDGRWLGGTDRQLRALLLRSGHARGKVVITV